MASVTRSCSFFALIEARCSAAMRMPAAQYDFVELLRWQAFGKHIQELTQGRTIHFWE